MHVHCWYQSYPYDLLRRIGETRPTVFTAHDVAVVNQYGTECWECYTTTTTLGEVFTFPTELSAFEDYTLLQALKFGGGTGIVGKTRNLLRHAVAALQNACDPDVAYPMGHTGVINAVNEALATLDEDAIQDLHTELAMYNEYGCPQDAHCNPIEEEEDGFMR